MKKRTIIVFIVIAVLSLSLSVLELTGNITKEKGKCIDSDNTSFYLQKNEPSFYTKGTTRYENRDNVYEDYCVRGAKLKEYYCDNSNIIRSKRISCYSPCINGACTK